MLTIRPVTPADAEAVRAVLVQTWHATYDAFMGPERVTAITDEWHAVGRLRAECAREHAAFLLAEEDGAVVGTASARRVDDGIRLDRLYVLPAFQGRGIGARLLQEALAILGASDPVHLEVHVDNARAIAFYERHGFSIVGRDGEHLLMHRAGSR